MKKNHFIILLFFTVFTIKAQVGINTTDPKAQLEIKSSNEVTPTNTDGLLIPKINVFPATNPTIDQQGMLVYLKNASGTNQPGFYYWNFGTLTWIPMISGTSGGTLDQSYDFGGAGNGKTITADVGAVLINGTDGLVSTGTLNSGVIVPSGAGTRMVWNPRKSAFRAGNVQGNIWDDTNIGLYSVAFGSNNKSSGNASSTFGFSNIAIGQGASAFGVENTVTGNYATAFGFINSAIGNSSIVFGQFSTVSGINSTSFGSSNIASGTNSTAFGQSNASKSFAETVFGIGATDYTPTSETQFSNANATDRLFVVGNALDANNNNVVDTSERSDALIILKNGLTRLPSTTNAMITAADGKTVITKEYLQSNTTAWGLTGNAGINVTTNFIGTTDNADVIFKRNNGRAGLLGASNTSFGVATISPFSSGTNNTAFGIFALSQNNTGSDNTANGSNALFTNTSGSRNTANGFLALRGNSSGSFNTAIGSGTLSDNNTGSNNTANGYDALANNTTGTNNTAIGVNTLITNNAGSFNTAIGSDANVSSTIFTNATAIGSKALAGNNNVLILGSINGINGATSSVNVGIGTTSPQTKLEVVDVNKTTTVTTEGNLNVITNNPQAINIGASISLGGTNNDAGSLYRTFATIEGRKSNSTTANNAGYLLFKTSDGSLTEKMRITNLGDVGIGTPNPGGQFELTLNEGRKPTSNTWIIPSDARLKTVNGIYEKGLTEILQLKPIKYNYKNTDKKTFETEVLNKQAYGFLAQEVQPLFPEAVGVDDDGYLNFDLHPILIASINAFKELNEKLQLENQTLKTKLEAQDQTIAEIIERLKKLENKN